MNMGRPLSSGAYSTTEPDGKPAAAPSDARVDKVPTLQEDKHDGNSKLTRLDSIMPHEWKFQLQYGTRQGDAVSATLIYWHEAWHLCAAIQIGTWRCLAECGLPQRSPGVQH